MEEKKYCLCGCGEEIFTRTARFKSGHSKNLKNKKPPLCACGCGEETHFDKWDNKWNEFLPGHCSRVRSEETIQKLSESNKGKTLSEETRRKISEANKGREKSETERKKLSEWAKTRVGENSPNFGKKKTEEHKKKIGDAHRGKIIPQEMRDRLSAIGRTKTGENSNGWKGGTTKINHLVRNCVNYSEWRTEVFERDNYTCQECDKRGGGTLHAHHLKPFAEILSQCNIKTLDDAINTQELWDINNGITLCKKCHKALHRKINQPKETI